MKGILIRPETEKKGNCESAVEPYADSSMFTLFFLPILAELAPFSWIGHVEFISGTELGPAIAHYNSREKYYPCGVLLPFFAPFFNDDWASLYGFAPGKKPSRAMLEAFPPSCDMIEKEAEIAFFNVDGWGWELYAKRSDLIDRVKRHLSFLPRLEVREAELQDRPAFAPLSRGRTP